MSQSRIKPLDGVRGIAVLLVFLSHTSGRDQYLAEFLRFNGIGHVGVYLFFCLSAFLLGLGLMSKEFNKKNLRNFYIKRFFRITPLYFFVVTSVYVYQLLSGNYDEKYLHISNDATGYLQHLIYYRGDGVFWSIVVEIQFYLIVPLLVWLIIKKFKAAIIILSGLATINVLLYLSKYALHTDWINYISPNTLQRGTFIDIFIVGLFAAYLVVHKNDWIRRNLKTIHLIATLSFSVLLLLTFILVCENFLGFRRPFYEFKFLSPLFSSVFSLFIVSVYHGNPLNKYLKNRLLCYTGIVGFSFYLIHLAIFQGINMTTIPPFIKFFLSYVLIMLVSTITYRLLEKPSMNWSYRLINYLDKKDITN